MATTRATSPLDPVRVVADGYDRIADRYLTARAETMPSGRVAIVQAQYCYADPRPDDAVRVRAILRLPDALAVIGPPNGNVVEIWRHRGLQPLARPAQRART
jgi:hypothetical protein